MNDVPDGDRFQVSMGMREKIHSFQRVENCEVSISPITRVYSYRRSLITINNIIFLISNLLHKKIYVLYRLIYSYSARFLLSVCDGFARLCQISVRIFLIRQF